VGSIAPSLGWSIAGTGDFDADNKSDILFVNKNGGVATWLMNGGTVLNGVGIGSLPAGWSVAVTGDFNGDRRSDILFLCIAAQCEGAPSNSVGIWLIDALRVPPDTPVIAALGIGSLPSDWQLQSMNAD
jgi:hypothetical protein